MNRGTASTLAAASAVLFAACYLIAQNSKPIPGPSSPGATIDAATKAAARNHARKDAIDVLSDTQGVDFGPYLNRIQATIRENWYHLIPQSLQSKKGRLAIEFKILKDGNLADMKLVASAGADLDRPAWGSITASNPFPPLPETFSGQYLALRFRYLYNPDRADLASSGVLESGAATSPIQHAVLIQSATDSHPIKYPQKAIDEKTDGVVRLVAEISPDGAVGSVDVTEGSLLLGDAASEAIHQWRFRPAQQDGKSVADQVRIRVEFRLDGQQIRWALFPSQAPTNAKATP